MLLHLNMAEREPTKCISSHYIFTILNPEYKSGYKDKFKKWEYKKTKTINFGKGFINRMQMFQLIWTNESVFF